MDWLAFWKCKKPKESLDANSTEKAGRVLKIRVFLLIENRLLRDVLTHLLRRQGDLELTGNGGRDETNSDEVARGGFDVALLDFVHLKWISVAREQSRVEGRAIKIVVIGMDAESAPFLEAVRCGVTGYLLKDASAADVVTAVRAAVRGEAICPPQLCTVLFQTVAQIGRDRGVKRPGSRVELTLRQQKLNSRDSPIVPTHNRRV